MMGGIECPLGAMSFMLHHIVAYGDLFQVTIPLVSVFVLALAILFLVFFANTSPSSPPDKAFHFAYTRTRSLLVLKELRSWLALFELSPAA